MNRFALCLAALCLMPMALWAIASPTPSISPTSLEFNAYVGESSAQSFTIGNHDPVVALKVFKALISGPDASQFQIDLSSPITVGSAPTGLDTDSDGIEDAVETVLGTNPNSWDSDGDWYYDFDEYGLSDPLNILSTPATGDTDGDYISDILEAIIGTDPNNIDTDGDGVDDGSEEDLGYDPLDSSSPSLSFPPPPIYIFPASSGQVNVAFYPGSSGTKQL